MTQAMENPQKKFNSLNPHGVVSLHQILHQEHRVADVGSYITENVNPLPVHHQPSTFHHTPPTMPQTARLKTAQMAPILNTSFKDMKPAP